MLRRERPLWLIIAGLSLGNAAWLVPRLPGIALLIAAALTTTVGICWWHALTHTQRGDL
jgi:hypothetical protein